MKDPIKFIKNAYFTALDGAITYNGSTIPVYDEEADETGGDYYIIISTIVDADLPNKAKFMNEVEVLIDVVCDYSPVLWDYGLEYPVLLCREGR